MIDVERSVVINRPPKDVFAFVSNLRNEPQFHTDVREATQTSKGPLGVGTTFDMRRTKPSMGVDRASARVIRFDPDREISFETHFGKMRPVRTYRVEPSGTGSKVTHRLQLQLSGGWRIMSFMMRRMVAKSWDRFLGNLKRVLEG